MKGLAAALAGAIVVTSLSATAADAAKRKQYQYRSDAEYRYRAPAQYRYGSDSTSLDGRVTGYPRTCGFDTFRRDSSIATIGPYCH